MQIPLSTGGRGKELGSRPQGVVITKSTFMFAYVVAPPEASEHAAVLCGAGWE